MKINNLELQQIHARYFHPEKSPGGINMLTGRKTYTGNEDTLKKRFDKNRGELLVSKKQFKGNLRRTFNF